jgi:phosphopantothenoylcysteine decarboxylase/phosphopantothenate--cysteine ligase
MSNSYLTNRKIVLGITGSIAAYKACEVLRTLKDAGAEVRVMMTPNSRRFLGEATMQCLSRNEVRTDMFASPVQSLPDHLSLSQWADVILIAPATANVIGKAAAGIADDIVSTTILAAIQKVVFAPAMNPAMYENPVVQENIAKLRRVGCEFAGPETGVLASGERGVGRLASPDLILQTVISVLKRSG